MSGVKYGHKSTNIKACSPQCCNLLSKNSQVKPKRKIGECMLAFIYLFLNLGVNVDKIKQHVNAVQNDHIDLALKK